MSKKAFDLSRNSIYVADPTTDLRIVGGSVLSGEESGDVDTEDDSSHPLWDARRLAEPITEEFVANVDYYGVLEPVIIAKLDDVPTVVAGRTRVRAARIVNARRKQRGEKPITIECKMRRDDDKGLAGVMIAENEVRRNDDVLAKMEKAAALLNRGVSEEDVAVTFGVKVITLRGWLAFADNATKETKKAVADGRVSATAAAELARVKDPEKQSSALSTMLAAPGKKTVTAARRATANATGKKASASVVGLSARRTRTLLDAVVSKQHPNASEKTMAWWQGVEDALKIVLGENDADKRLAEIVASMDT